MSSLGTKNNRSEPDCVTLRRQQTVFAKSALHSTDQIQNNSRVIGFMGRAWIFVSSIIIELIPQPVICPSCAGSDRDSSTQAQAQSAYLVGVPPPRLGRDVEGVEALRIYDHHLSPYITKIEVNAVRVLFY